MALYVSVQFSLKTRHTSVQEADDHHTEPKVQPLEPQSPPVRNGKVRNVNKELEK